MASNTLDHVAQKGHDKEIVKFSEIFAISMLKKHRKWRGLTHLDNAPISKIVQILMRHPVYCLPHFGRSKTLF